MGEDTYTSLSDLHIPSKEYVLVTPGWYPTWLDPMPGDFNQRHVKAAGLYKPQVVLYIGKDQTKQLKKIEVRYRQVTENVVEILVVYPTHSSKLLDPFSSHIIYLRLLYEYSALIGKKFGPPKLIHAYIVIRGGLSAMMLSRKWKVPFLLSENWTIYYSADPGYYKNRNLIFKKIVKQVFNNVARFLPVSINLQEEVQKLFGAVPTTVIPNVVETEKFYYDSTIMVETNVFRYIHVSTNTYQKNPEGLLRAYKLFTGSTANCILTIVGPSSPELIAYSKQIGLTQEEIIFTGTLDYGEVAAFVKKANALVLFSRYENLPCVILEALCCGVPVISTSVGGIAEVIDETNGILIQNENEEQLSNALKNMHEDYMRYDRKRIAEKAANLFSYTSVGKQMNNAYNVVLNPSISR
ncbi:MAG: hypothetical protein JWQ96_782 [Segetibacter sp.]|nr:hypothetical protein [Segetibacter sp.]